MATTETNNPGDNMSTNLTTTEAVLDDRRARERARREYAAIAKRAGMTAAELTAAAREQGHATDATTTPAQWVAAARRVRCRCGRCAGTGQFVTMVLNGRPTGPGGICFRCEGKGYQTDADRRRNYGHDLHYMARAC